MTQTIEDIFNHPEGAFPTDMLIHKSSECLAFYTPTDHYSDPLLNAIKTSVRGYKSEIASTMYKGKDVFMVIIYKK